MSKTEGTPHQSSPDSDQSIVIANIVSNLKPSSNANGNADAMEVDSSTPIMATAVGNNSDAIAVPMKLQPPLKLEQSTELEKENGNENESDEEKIGVDLDNLVPSTNPIILQFMNLRTYSQKIDSSNAAFGDLDVDSLDTKPWEDKDADVTDWFNYGFTEQTWRDYCAAQIRWRTIQKSQPLMAHQRHTNAVANATAAAAAAFYNSHTQQQRALQSTQMQQTRLPIISGDVSIHKPNIVAPTPVVTVTDTSHNHSGYQPQMASHIQQPISMAHPQRTIMPTISNDTHPTQPQPYSHSHTHSHIQPTQTQQHSYPNQMPQHRSVTQPHDNISPPISADVTTDNTVAVAVESVNPASSVTAGAASVVTVATVADQSSPIGDVSTVDATQTGDDASSQQQSTGNQSNRDNNNICFDFQNKGYCSRGDSCRWSHIHESMSADRQKGICFEFQNKGFCNWGGNCRWKHITKEGGIDHRYANGNNNSTTDNNIDNTDNSGNVNTAVAQPFVANPTVVPGSAQALSQLLGVDLPPVELPTTAAATTNNNSGGDAMNLPPSLAHLLTENEKDAQRGDRDRSRERERDRDRFDETENTHKSRSRSREKRHSHR